MDKLPGLLSMVIGAAVMSLCPIVMAETSFSAKLCKTPGYSCYKAKSGDSWTSLWPNLEQRRKVMQVNRINTSLYKNRVIAIPDDLKNKTMLDLAPFARQIDAPGEKLLIFDPSAHAWAAYNSMGDLVRWGAASGGSNWCEDVGRSCRTPVGDFRIYHKGDSDCISTKYPLPDGGAHMPYCMFFHRGFALHGSPGAVMGYNASHGCTRLFVHDAQWLNQEFAEIGTRVIVKPYGRNFTPKSLRVKQTIVREAAAVDVEPVVSRPIPNYVRPPAADGETILEEIIPQ